ncbi:multicystatin-like isoform X2 [Biomphalaria pfeifferi]|uniref:Multicystatin-like isoform X2 n=1 Tax=Biomphalaria pfeifferi TaxID=112525 RepID=A0AAD8BAH5_BIOPF|nr:multicystatin-like isoform X2 [Biomphalaria pfeifferi]
MSNHWSVLVVSLVLFVSCEALGLVGGWSKASLPNDDPAVTLALQAINRSKGDNKTRTLLRTSIRSQVVAGVNYEITAYVTNGKITEKCTTTIWVRVWEKEPDQYKITKDPTCVKV